MKAVLHRSAKIPKTKNTNPLFSVSAQRKSLLAQRHNNDQTLTQQRVTHNMETKSPSNSAAATLPSVSTAAPQGTCRPRSAPELGRVVFVTRSKKVLAVGTSRGAAEAASQFSGAGLGRPVVCQCSLGPRYFAFNVTAKKLTPNHSLNRTHCGVPPFGLEKPSPNASTPQWAG